MSLPNLGTGFFQQTNYTGDRNEKGEKHGFGIENKNGIDKYSGEFRHDQRHGYGILQKFENGQFSEKEVAHYRNGSKTDYKGETKSATLTDPETGENLDYQRPHGYGVQDTGYSRYYGQFEDGKRHGHGVSFTKKQDGTIGPLADKGIYNEDKHVKGPFVYTKDGKNSLRFIGDEQEMEISFYEHQGNNIQRFRFRKKGEPSSYHEITRINNAPNRHAKVNPNTNTIGYSNAENLNEPLYTDDVPDSGSDTTLDISNPISTGSASFQGEMDDSGQRLGKGVLKKVYKNNKKTKYIGDFVDNKKEGSGLKDYNDKHMYHGNWKSNLKDGDGFYSFNNEKSFIGEFKNDIPKEGSLVQLNENGNIFQGTFDENSQPMDGTFIVQNGKTVHKDVRNGEIVPKSEDDELEKKIVGHAEKNSTHRRGTKRGSDFMKKAADDDNDLDNELDDDDDLFQPTSSSSKKQKIESSDQFNLTKTFTGEDQELPDMNFPTDSQLNNTEKLLTDATDFIP